MTRLPFSASALVLAVAVSGLLAVQLPKDPPKEPTNAGKSASEWIKLLSTGTAPEREKAADALRAIPRLSGNVIEQVIAAAADPATDRSAVPLLSDLLVNLGPTAVPALTQGLWSAEERTRLVCCYVLGGMGADGRSAVPSLARLLADPDELVRKHAVDSLRRIGSHAALPALFRLRGDRAVEVRLATARALIDLGASAEEAIPTLLEIKGGDGGEQEFASRLLALLGPEAAPTVPALVSRLPEVKPPVAAEIAIALGRTGPAAKDAIPALKKKLAESEKDAHLIQLPIARALWQIARDPAAAQLLRDQVEAATTRDAGSMAMLWRIDTGPDTVATLTRLLNPDRPFIAITAAMLLGTKVKEAVPLLGKLLAHKDAQVRAQAVAALVRLGLEAKEAAEALRAATKDDVPLIAFWATTALCRLTPTAETVAAVAGSLSDPDPFGRIQAAEVLGHLGVAGKPAVGRLTGLLEDPDEQVQLASAVALWRIDHHPLALPAAIKLLRSQDPRMREQAAVELGATFGTEGKPLVPDLVKRLFDPFSGVRSSSAEALGRIGPAAREAVPALLAILEADEPGFVQSAACEALGLIVPTDKEAATAVLRRKLEHPDALTRAHAALALVLINGDKTGEKEAERGLGYRTYQVRITAAEALWRMKQDARAVPFLVRTLEESNLDGASTENERYMVARALGRIGPAAKPAVPELIKLLNHHDPMLAATAREAIEKIKAK